ncbi:hypothetical protein J3F84DRAFT_345505 [Trichoderma pleuroticola]
MSSEKTQAAALADSAKPILVNGALPEEWRDNEENPGTNIDRALADVARRSLYWESRGMPGITVSFEKSKIVPTQYVDPRYVKYTGDRLDTEYITLQRKSLPDQPEKPTCYVMEGKERVGIDFVIVPKEENYRDYRPVDRPTDVISFDNPAADTDRYLEHGNKVVSEVMTDSWRPGQLVGENGSDPATIAQSPSFAPPNPNLEFSERRSATSTGHILQYERPPGVSLGWGDYDRFAKWQSFGRRVTKDMVEKKDWQKDPLAPVDFVDESGNFVETLTIPFTREQLFNAAEPLSLYERLNPPDNRKQKAFARRIPVRPKTSNDETDLV